MAGFTARHISLYRIFGMLMRLILCSLLACLAWQHPAVAQTCGAVGEPCEIDGGEYFIALPDEANADTALFVFLHGSGGTGEAGARNTGFSNRVTSRGYAFITPSGAERDWGVFDGLEEPRDDVTFLRTVIEDAATRFDLNRDVVLLTGFSRGSSMVWDMACRAPDVATAYAGSAGGFWEPMHQDCEAPVHLHHSHGFRDTMVPLEGRQGVWRERPFHQGNILKGLDIWRATNGCMGAADTSVSEGVAWTKQWESCDAGSIFLQVWDGGHGMPSGWSQDVMDWFEGLEGQG